MGGQLHLRKRFISAIAFAVVAAGRALAAAPSVDATIEPSQISMGESARLTIQTTGSGAITIALPVVSGLEFRIVGQSRQFQMINGVTIESTSTIVRVTPEESGVFTIPGLTPKSPPLVLRVVPESGSGSSLSPNNSAPGINPLLPGSSAANGIRLTPDGSAFVRLEVAKHEIYVGESVPAEIQIGMREGFATSINGLPKLNSNDFTLNNLSLQPERAAKTIEGKLFTVYTWHSLLAAIKPGTFALTFAAPVTVRIRTQPRRDSMLDDLLGDPFLQNIFGATVQKNITVTSPEAAFTVMPLPTQDKPPDFGGAVGTFKISADVSSDKNTAGDPLTLRMHVNGAGNFDRVESSMLGGDARWKTYDPKATFKPSDPTGFRGEKTFEQPLIASKAGAQTIPALSISFFNPETRRYETARSSPLNVMVSPSTADNASNELPPQANAAGTPVDEAHTGLRPDHAAGKKRVDSLMPLYFQQRFVGFSSVLALLFGGGWMAMRRRERHANDVQGERERVRLQKTRALMEQMAAASAGGDTARFFSAAHSALQLTLGARWQIAPEQVTAVEIDARLGDDADKDDIRQIFALADEANYSGDHLQAADFDRWTEIVRHRLTPERAS
jgi:hypothetical protein